MYESCGEIVDDFINYLVDDEDQNYDLLFDEKFKVICFVKLMLKEYLF